MNLYIMSRGRSQKVTTLLSIPSSWFKRTYLIVPKAEVEAYKDNYDHVATVIGAPDFVTNYSEKVQWILNGFPHDDLHEYWQINTLMNETDGKAVILDDDLVFSRKIDGRLITERDPAKMGPMFKQMEDLLNDFALVGVHPRQMGQNAAEPYVLNGRIICIQGINRRWIGPVKVDQLPILADVILNLTLLARGQSNALITTYFQDHGPCQAPGGCSIYRTPDMQRQAVDYLVGRWPGFVKAVVRKPKVAKWMGDERYEYTAQWKKLRAAAPDREVPEVFQ